MVKNDGSMSERLFEEIMKSRGKSVNVYRLPDTKQIKQEFQHAFVRAAPSDYIVTEDGEMYYAEVKSSSDGRASFTFNHITPSQWAAMVKQRAAGGKYFLFIHNITTETWYKVPANAILRIHDEEKRKSVKWTELASCQWNHSLPVN